MAESAPPFDLITMGRIGVDLYPLRSAVSPAQVDTLGKLLGGSTANVAVYRQPKAPDLEIHSEGPDRLTIRATRVRWIAGTGPSQEPGHTRRAPRRQHRTGRAGAGRGGQRPLRRLQQLPVARPAVRLGIGRKHAVRQPDRGSRHLASRLLPREAHRGRDRRPPHDDFGHGTFELTGRDSAFSAVSDFAHAPRDARTTVSAACGGRFALTGARCVRRLPARHGPASAVPVELRGTGNSSRQVKYFGTAVPDGWHGPSMAGPGHPMYCLNVMAGPEPERARLIRDHPDHAWVRDSWPDQPVDARLPLYTAPEKS